MNYLSIAYLVFFVPIVLLCYGVSKKKLRPLILLAASYIFFFQVSKFLIVYLIFSTILTYIFGRLLRNGSRPILVVAIILNLSVLIFLKYGNFILTNVTHSPFQLTDYKFASIAIFAVPIGISFYTMQVISYLVDVYRKDISPETKLHRLALYLAFFPTLVEGPICRYHELKPSLFRGKPLEIEHIVFGAQRIFWGVFKNIMIADRLNQVVKNVFDNYLQYDGLIIFLAAVCYTIQLYMNFSGVVDITIGVGEMFGIPIKENFRQPFFAKTVTEFWQRWHISLGSWFKDYVFYPLSFNRHVKNTGKKVKKKFGRHTADIVKLLLPLFVVWLFNGFWHGPRWSYIFFGFYYYFLIMAGIIVEPWVKKIRKYYCKDWQRAIWRCFQAVKMLLIVVIGEMFFRGNGLRAGLVMFRRILLDFSLDKLTNGGIFDIGLTFFDFLIIIGALLIVLIVDILHERGVSIRKQIADWPLLYRWSFYQAAILAVIIFGAYGEGYLPGELIYGQF